MHLPQRALPHGNNELTSAQSASLSGDERGDVEDECEGKPQLRVLEPQTPSIIADTSMQELYRVAAQVARGKIPVLIIGETGVGKEHLAQFVHDASPRASHPFVMVNCAALNESLFESELFGHERGAFTGATASKVGLLEAAGKGTVFLDEIGELPLSMQAKLLRAIETGGARRVGGIEPRLVEARVVAATNRLLEDMVEEGTFRRDLYHRVAGIRLEVPPLRMRRTEIPLLANLFAEEACRDLGTPMVQFSAEASEALLVAPWLGNIRELKNTVERAVLLVQEKQIELKHLYFGRATARAENEGVVTSHDAQTLPNEVATTDRKQMVLAALAACGGNQTLAAHKLSISRRTLSRWLDGLEIPRPRKYTVPMPMPMPMPLPMPLPLPLDDEQSS